MSQLVQDKTIKTMLGAIDDRGLRQQVIDEIKGNATHEIRCMGKCRDKVVGHLFANAPRPYVKAKRNSDKSGIYSDRKRFDGEWGFRCLCGNNSIMAKEEEGNMPIANKPGMASMPDKEQLLRIAGKLEKRKPGHYKETGAGVKEVDGFKIVRL